MTSEEPSLAPDERHEVLRVARAAGADLFRPVRRVTHGAELLGARVRAFGSSMGETVFEGLVVGYRDHPSVLIECGELRPRPWGAHLVEELIPAPPGPVVVAELARRTRGVCAADVSTARALHALRPAIAPWPVLPYSMRRNLAVAAMPLRRALVAEGWVPPAGAWETP